MKIPFVDLYAQYLTIKQEIDRAIAEVIAESAYIGGRHVDAFEQAWASAVGVKRCISCANGTDAIYIALRALRIKPGDEVITSAHSSISTSETIKQAGGRVVFCDTDEETFTVDPDDIQRKITPATVGIIPVHLYGQPADMDAIMAIAKRHNLWVIEDCGQAHLARYRGRRSACRLDNEFRTARRKRRSHHGRNQQPHGRPAGSYSKCEIASFTCLD